MISWTAFGICVGIGILVAVEEYDDGHSFPSAAARGMIWPIVFVVRIVKVTCKALKEVWK